MPPVRIAIVAGETSGDYLAAGLIQALRRLIPDAEFEGVAGPQMIAAGCTALFPADKLALLGLVEVLGHLPEVLSIRRRLLRRYRRDPPDLFIGVDAPDFNLALEARLRSSGIKTAHYVSPTVWAWRGYRVRQIARAVDLMLSVFPFEVDFYRSHDVPVRFVGHPLADLIPLESDRQAARRALDLKPTGPLVALLPGSRGSELRYLGAPFLDTAWWCLERKPDLEFITPLASPRIRAAFEALLVGERGALPLRLIDGQSRMVMQAADLVLTASGTATLEALLLKRPMVVAYRMAFLTQWLVRRLLKVPYFSLPNLLAGRPVVEEFFQDEVRAERMGPAVLEILERPDKARALQETFTAIHQSMRRDASHEAAAALLRLLEDGQAHASAA